MAEIVAPRSKDISPVIVAESVLKEASNLKELFVVGLPVEGGPLLWTCGELSSLSFAALILNDYAVKHLNGCVEEEER